MKTVVDRAISFVDLLLVPLVFPAAFLLKKVRMFGIKKLPRVKRVLLQVGIFPIRNHYYEPLFDPRLLHRPLSSPRQLPGIDWNLPEQLNLVRSFKFENEIQDLPEDGVGHETFYLNNGAFEAGDAEFLYQMIRTKKPRRFVEIGSGYSTLVSKLALDANRSDQRDYFCEHICIEPFEMPWLEELGVEVKRKRAEEVDLSFFGALESGDILFIDSSHMIRPQGDVLFIYLEVLPTLSPGVIVHVHDVFSPRDYLTNWIKEDIRFWNEQYLLEAFLCDNAHWKIIGAVNMLHHAHYELLKTKCPGLTPNHEPGSFYLEKKA